MYLFITQRIRLPLPTAKQAVKEQYYLCYIYVTSSISCLFTVMSISKLHKHLSKFPRLVFHFQCLEHPHTHTPVKKALTHSNPKD